MAPLEQDPEGEGGESGARGLSQKRTFYLALAALLVLSAFSYTLGKGLIWPHRVDDLDEAFANGGDGFGFGFQTAPGTEHILLDFFQGVETKEPITIESVTPASPSGPAEVIDLALAVRRPGEPFLSPFRFDVDPTTDWRDCDALSIEEPAGYEVQPGEMVFLVERVRLTGPGKGRLPSATVTFRRDGKRYRSTPGTNIHYTVRKRFDYEDRRTWEWECSHPEAPYSP